METPPHKNINNLIRAVKREIELRRVFYPMRIIQGKMTEGNAKYEINCMKEICLILNIVDRLGLLDSKEAQTERLIIENTQPELRS